jgi:transposase InsO family protein
VTLELVATAVAAGARIHKACEVVGIAPKTLKRWKQNPDGEDERRGPTRSPAHKLSDEERARVIALATSPEYRDLSPKQIVPLLADKGTYVASESSFYRVLEEAGMSTHRGPARPPRKVAKPKEHVATGPCQVWTWDITYLRAPVRGTYFYLYLFLDIYSRKIVAAEVHEAEDMEVSAAILEGARERESAASTLVLHADNGGPMKGSTMLSTMQRLGVVASFSRPRVSDDNPFSEALFRTLKYRPGYPRKPFASLEEARRWVDGFVRWYNHEHLHSALRFVTPAARHEERDTSLLAGRRRVYASARHRTPRRWTGAVRNWSPVGAVALNPISREVHTAA